jgi:hypothetical protein
MSYLVPTQLCNGDGGEEPISPANFQMRIQPQRRGTSWEQCYWCQNCIPCSLNLVSLYSSWRLISMSGDLGFLASLKVICIYYQRRIAIRLRLARCLRHKLKEDLTLIPLNFVPWEAQTLNHNGWYLFGFYACQVLWWVFWVIISFSSHKSLERSDLPRITWRKMAAWLRCWPSGPWFCSFPG